MPDVREAYEMVTKQKPPEPGALERQQKRQVRTARNKKLGAFAVAAAIGLAAMALFLGTRPGGNAITPAVDSPTVDPEISVAEEVATSFVAAYGAFDADQAITYLADDADLTGLISSLGSRGMEGTAEELPLLISLEEALGHVQLLDSCEATGRVGTDILVRCTFDFQSLRSDEIGVGPFSGSYFDLVVSDGEIVRASMYFDVEEFSPQVWEPFAAWVSTTYPKDAATMYEDLTYSEARLTEESIRLWEQHTWEYVEVEIAQMVATAESFMEARNAYDDATAMSLLADGPVTAQLMDDNRMNGMMPGVQLNRDELALAFEAERLYGVRYESFECHPGGFSLAGDGGSASVICSYSMDSRLRQLAGSPPLESSFGLGVREGRIDVLTFPWLNISWNPGGYLPAEFEKFVMWLDTAHPEAIDTERPMDAQRIFRTVGQEWILKLTPESLDLLAGYLDEYERSVNG